MRTNLAGHLIPTHWSQEDERQLARIRPRSVKIIEHFSSERLPTRTMQVHNLSPRSLLVLRNHPLSEQHDDVWRDPEGTGTRHADDWAAKFSSWSLNSAWRAIPSEQIVVLGINEFPIWDDRGGPNEGKPNAKGTEIEARYWLAFILRCHTHGIRPGVYNRNTGWPANWGTDLPPIWDPWLPTVQPLLDADGFAFLHHYWPKDGPEWHFKWHAGRYTQFPFDVPIIVGECGMNQRVANSSVNIANEGWQRWLNPETYQAQLDWYDRKTQEDPRIHSLQVFTWDFSIPFGSTDVRPIVKYWPQNTEFDVMTNWKGGSSLPPTDSLRQTFLAGADQYQTIQLNPNAALQKRIFADGFVPVSNEHDLFVSDVRVHYIRQFAEDLRTGAHRAYGVRFGDWGNVFYFER